MLGINSFNVLNHENDVLWTCRPGTTSKVHATGSRAEILIQKSRFSPLRSDDRQYGNYSHRNGTTGVGTAEEVHILAFKQYAQNIRNADGWQFVEWSSMDTKHFRSVLH